jgi:microcompartment protein CcmK/EutM
MQLAKVIGTVVATQKSERLDGLKLLVICPMNPDGSLSSNYLVAADAVGAGVDEVVLYASGSSARQTEATQNRPSDSTIIAIVDTVEVGGDVVYEKATAEAIKP